MADDEGAAALALLDETPPNQRELLSVLQQAVLYAIVVVAGMNDGERRLVRVFRDDGEGRNHFDRVLV